MKILAAIVTILAALGAVYLIVNGMGRGGASSPSRPESVDVSHPSPAANERADSAPTRMQPGDWNNLIAVAIKQRCPIEGMTKAQAEQAFGKPLSSSGAAGQGEAWKYEVTSEGECIRNEVAKCVEHLSVRQQAIYAFSPNGHLTYPSQDELFHPNCLTEPFYSRYFKPLELSQTP